MCHVKPLTPPAPSPGDSVTAAKTERPASELWDTHSNAPSPIPLSSSCKAGQRVKEPENAMA